MQLKIRIVVTTQGLTFDDSPYSIFLIQLFAALAELESNHASERIKAGLSVARAKGMENLVRLLHLFNRKDIPIYTPAGAQPAIGISHERIVPYSMYIASPGLSVGS